MILVVLPTGRRPVVIPASKARRRVILIKSRKMKVDRLKQQVRSLSVVNRRDGENNFDLDTAAIALVEQLEAEYSETNVSSTELIKNCNNLQHILDESMQVATGGEGDEDSSTVVSIQTVRCKQFLCALLRMSRDEHPELAAAIQPLIQDLIDAELEPEEFINKLQKELDCSSSETDLILPLIKV